MSSSGARAWKAMFSLLQSQKAWIADRLTAFDLTPQQAHALHVLSELEETTMSTFAASLFCDASNATGLVDRLAARGIVERRPAPADRRAKVVRLTAAGRRLERKIDEMLKAEAPPAIAALSAADQRTLREILERAVALGEGTAQDKTA
jgi:DNA-binding MarR family transcriptional regulator